jgi:outer membrane protein OmpA-like peptidoglycan-associated protein
MTHHAGRLAGLVLALACAAPAMACQYRQAAVDAVEAGDFARAETLQQEISVDPACDDAFRLWLDEAVARDYFARAMAADTTQDQRALLEASVGFFPHWRSYSALGDLAALSGAHTEAARQYQQAINQMNDGPDHHSATDDEAQQLITRTANAMLLADRAVDVPATRSGTPGGIFIENLRGYQVEEVSLAIEFVFDSTDLTPKGQQYADKLFDYLKERQPPRIVLEGHTDPVGASDYNDRLSLRRAERLKAYLEARGYSGTIGVVGRGETMVPPAPSGAVPDSPEHHQIARRVVLIR